MIKDGEFVGRFEEMYRDCPDPWLQDGEISPAEETALAVLGESRFDRVLDLGCGKGRFTARLARHAREMVAVDISPTALVAARSRIPEHNHVAASVPPLPVRPGTFDLVVASHLLWYVLPGMATLLVECAASLRPGGRLLIIQQFYPPGRQRYGLDIMRRPEDVIERTPLALERRIDIDPEGNWKSILLFKKEANA